MRNGNTVVELYVLRGREETLPSDTHSSLLKRIMDHISQHKSDFEKLYRALQGMKGEWNFRFPLEEIEGFDWNRGKWANEYYHYFYRRFSSHILSRLLLQDGQKILVMGCGFGFDEKNIKALNKSIELWSIDVSEEMIKRAIRNQSPSHFSIGAAEKLPFPDCCFDRVLAREVIEHVLDPKAMLQEIARVLKDGGRAVVTTENYHSLAASHRYDKFIKPGIAKLCQFPLPKPSYKDQALSTSKIKSDADQGGLRLVECFRDGALYKCLPKWAPLLKTNLTRIAQWFSCLENHSTLGGLFCDQIKFVFVKKEVACDGLALCHDVFWACPVCKKGLYQHPGFYWCESCQRKYSFAGDFPNFLLDEIGEAANSISTYERGKRRDSFMASVLEVMFKTLNLICRSLYECSYVGLSIMATFIAKRNYPYLSNILSKEDSFQQYIKIYPKR